MAFSLSYANYSIIAKVFAFADAIPSTLTSLVRQMRKTVTAAGQVHGSKQSAEAVSSFSGSISRIDTVHVLIVPCTSSRLSFGQ